MIYVIKKDGTREEFDPQKIVKAVNKSAARILYKFSPEEKDFICRFAQEHADSLGKNEIEIQEMHNIVEGALERVNPAVAKSYRDYRNYKLDFIHMMDDVYTAAILSLDVNTNSLKRLKEIEDFTKKNAEKVYKESNKYKVIKILRKSNYHLYALGSIAFKLYHKVLPS